jgi:molybdopterin-containing oxidoreductase family iron-sulfur binding subunit
MTQSAAPSSPHQPRRVGGAVNPARATVDLAAIRRRLASPAGPQYWRSLEELADSGALRALLQHEAPRHVALFDSVGRRQFLKLMGASLGLAGLNACTRQPAETIVPYVRQPEQLVPGTPLYFASAIPFGGVATPVLVESHMGRPTKIEGNPEHPASLGATDAFAQAAILGLYDPDRSQVITHVGEIRPWSAFVAALRTVLDAQREQRGAGLRILTETITSPTLADQLRGILAAFPLAKWHQYEPVHRDHAREGARLAFGEYVETHYQFDRAQVVLALDADFLSCGPGHLRYVREFMSRRRVQGEQRQMNRLYAVESTPTNTGALADHRLPLRPTQVEDLTRAIAAGLGVRVQAPVGLEAHAAWITAVTRDLQRHRGTSVVIAGAEQPPAVHALAHALNAALGNVGQTVVYTDPVEAHPVNQTASLRELVADMEAGTTALLLIIGGNPVFTAPADVPFAAALAKVPLSVHLGLYDDETSELCHWHVPEAHALESWSDLRAFDGTISIVQPLIAPLYGGKTAHEILAVLTDRPERSSHDIVKEYWMAQRSGDDFEAFWRRALHDGLVGGSALALRPVTLKDTALPSPRGAQDARALEIVFRPDPTIFDGRFANNGWLQELPKALTRLTWDNAALLSPATAQRLGLSSGDVVELRYAGRRVHAPVWIMPGHAPDAVTVHLGYGRRRAGKVGNGTGFNAYLLRTAAAPWSGTGLELHPTGARYALATTQEHHSMEGRALVRAGTLADYIAHPQMFRHMAEEPARADTLYPDEHPYPSYAWGMAIDLNTCTGCNACVIACQAENNIAVVGKAEVARGHEMHWIRIDRYYAGELDNPATYHQPVPCMHCENAPCELVCPVAATVHSSEGLNDMIYNRCVGTKYCSNNCPYKVRRFNWFLFSDWTTESLKAMRNPDVTVRSRGVMEKCTYCVQRINGARIHAQTEGREIRDGEVVTACQQACPAGAIVFGNINDPDSRVARLKAEARNYALLAELNTRPRTTYLARLRNPNPEIG